jgi:hypothetical protein
VGWVQHLVLLRAGPHLERLAAEEWFAPLRLLNLRGGGIGDAGARHLAASPHVAGLVTLDLRDNPIGLVGQEALRSSPRLPRLREVLLDGENLRRQRNLLAQLRQYRGDPAPANRPPIWLEDLPLLATSAHVHAISHLDLGGLAIGDAGLTQLTGSPHWRGLTWLNLRGANISDAGAEALARWPCLAGVVHLGLATTWLGRGGAVALAASAHLRRLTLLDLEGNHIGDGGARALALSPHLRRLEALDLTGNGIGAKGARALARSRCLRALHTLDLRGNALGGAVQAFAVPENLPRLARLVIDEKGVGRDALDALRGRLGDGLLLHRRVLVPGETAYRMLPGKLL